MTPSTPFLDDSGMYRLPYGVMGHLADTENVRLMERVMGRKFVGYSAKWREVKTGKCLVSIFDGGWGGRYVFEKSDLVIYER